MFFKSLKAFHNYKRIFIEWKPCAFWKKTTQNTFHSCTIRHFYLFDAIREQKCQLRHAIQQNISDFATYKFIKVSKSMKLVFHGNLLSAHIWYLMIKVSNTESLWNTWTTAKENEMSDNFFMALYFFCDFCGVFFFSCEFG